MVGAIVIHCMYVKTLPKSVLSDLYLEKKMTVNAIALQLGVNPKTVRRNLDVHGIPVRSISEATLIRYQTKSNHPRFKHGKRTKEFKFYCKCGREMNRGSTVCWNCYSTSEQNWGKSNPNYKGNADIMMMIRGYLRNTWRLKVFERDGFTCKECGSRHKIEAHHIVRLSDIVNSHCNGRPKETVEERFGLIRELINLEEINDINNGVTLCKECHKKKHRKVKPSYS
jgi:hypothetical protein